MNRFHLSAIFIARPVGTTLLTLGLFWVGILGFYFLPVAPLPQIDFPTISVSANLPGAAPEVMAATVATPLERALGSINGITEITSSSSLGNTRVTLQFDLDKDIDNAAREVQAALNKARALLPSGMPSNPTYRKSNPADAPMMILSLTSESLTRGQLFDAASTVLAQRLSQVSGIGQVNIGGGALPAVRVAVDPHRLASKGLSLENVRIALTAHNVNRPKGSLENHAQHWQITANDQVSQAIDYAPMILSYKNGSAVRLSDVALVQNSVQDSRTFGLANSKPSVLLVLFKQPNANVIEAVDHVKKLLPDLRGLIHPAIDLDIVSDRTPTIRASLYEVEKALVLALVLVVLVTLIFLKTLRAALIPAVAVLVSLSATVGAMYLLGYSLNNLTLMALTVATGFVVDDAIVMLENISRHIERGQTPLKAALLGSQQMGFTIVSISISLIAVFIPVLLMGGIVGRLFREFSVVLSVAVLISMVISLTTTPMMCAVLLRFKQKRNQNQNQNQQEKKISFLLPIFRLRILRRGERRSPKKRGVDLIGANAVRPYENQRITTSAIKKNSFFQLKKVYARSLALALRWQGVTLLILAAVIGLNVYLYQSIPKGFFPQQDTGRIISFIRADQASSFQAMQKRLIRFMALVQSDPAVSTISGFTGGSNSASMFISLKPIKERKESAEQVINRLRKKLSKEAGARLFMRSAQDIRVGARGSSSQFEYTLFSDELNDLQTWEPRIRRALAQLPEITDIDTDQEDKGLQTTLQINRDELARLGLTMRQVSSTLNNAFGQRQVSVIYNPLNQYRVVMELASDYLQNPESLNELLFMNSSGEAVPLKAFASTQLSNAAISIAHQSGTPASTISFNLNSNISLSDATKAVENAVEKLGVPTSIHGSFAGTAQAFGESLSNQPMLILAALIALYLVLGVLYESLIHPITILSTLPSAGVGALLALQWSQTEFSIMALIGVILLIGIVKKNAIMMIDFALHNMRKARQNGVNLSAAQAIYVAAQWRVRPIIMTTLAAILGAIPLAIGTGDGAELRQPLGIAIVGGLIVSQLLTLYTTPVVFVCFDRLRLVFKKRFHRIIV